jgi:hypothetical protein
VLSLRRLDSRIEQSALTCSAPVNFILIVSPGSRVGDSGCIVRSLRLNRQGPRRIELRNRSGLLSSKISVAARQVSLTPEGPKHSELP